MRRHLFLALAIFAVLGATAEAADIPVIDSLAARQSASDPSPIPDGGTTLARTPYFYWTASSSSPIVGYSILLSSDPAEVPAQTVNTTLTFSEQSLSQSGLYYFKVRPLNQAANWGPVTGMSFSFSSVSPENRTILKKNYFNPVLGECARLEVRSATPGRIQASVYTLLGEKISTVADAESPAGANLFAWCGRNESNEVVSNGAYILRLEAPGQKHTLKLGVIK